jgi:hypothetical protein
MPNRVVRGYLGYELNEESRVEALWLIPAVYPDVIARHVTTQFPATSDDPLPLPVATAEIVGIGDDGNGVQAVVVALDTNTARPDGSVFHITWSLDRSAGRKPMESNAVLKAGFNPIGPFPITLTPKFFRG